MDGALKRKVRIALFYVRPDVGILFMWCLRPQLRQASRYQIYSSSRLLTVWAAIFSLDLRVQIEKWTEIQTWRVSVNQRLESQQQKKKWHVGAWSQTSAGGGGQHMFPPRCRPTKTTIWCPSNFKKKNLESNAVLKNKTTTYSALMLRCLAFGGVGGAAARRSRRRFGSSFEVCISNTNRLSIRSLQLVWVQIHSCVQITRLIQTCSSVSASTDSKQSKMF